MGRPTTQPSTYYQLLYALRDGPLGRRTLVERTGITEMTVRTHLNKLRDAGLVDMAKSGTALTKHAKAQVDGMLDAIMAVQEVEIEELSLSPHNIAAQLRHSADVLKRSIYNYRDAAVKAGADGAMLLIWKPDGWAFPGEDRDLSVDSPEMGRLLQSSFSGGSGDLLVIAFGESLSAARAGLWSVIAEMFPTDLKSDIERDQK